jgi:ubiquinone biosynthesis protein UbiJ
VLLLENLLNRGLPRSPRAQQLCAELSGRSVVIAVRDIAGLRVSSNGQTLAIALVGSNAAADAPPAGTPAADAPAADATLSGGPLSLLELAGPSAQAVLQRGDVSISGDGELAEKFRELLMLLRPDLEEELSLVLGDVPAHQLGRLARGGARWARRALGVTVQNLAEYLGHERADLVPRNEGEQFLRGVDALREGVDRLEKRLELLARQRGAP